MSEMPQSVAPEMVGESLESLSRRASSSLIDRVRSTSTEASTKLILKTASDLAKYEVLENTGTHVHKRSVLKGRITVEEYKGRILNLLRLFANLQPPHAIAISQALSKIPDAPRIAQKLKDFNKELESRTARPSVTDNASVFMYDNEAKFQKLQAVFTATNVEEVYVNDSYNKQCAEIERLLKGEETEHSLREQGVMCDDEQRENVLRLSEMLHSLGTDGKLSFDPNKTSSVKIGGPSSF